MTTATEALTALRAALDDFNAIPLKWDGDNNDPLPDEPTAFAFAHFVVDKQDILSYGGGRGRNQWRSEGYLEFIVMTPIGTGAADGLIYAEQIAAVYRGQRIGGVSCMGASVSPGERDPDNGNYRRTYCVVEFHFDQTG